MDMNRNLDGHLGEGIEIKGTLRFEGSVRIDGKFVGKVVSPATLIVGPNAGLELLPRHQAYDKLLHARYLVEQLTAEWPWPS